MSAVLVDNYQAAWDALNYIDPDLERSEWIKIYFALVSEFGKQQGGDMFDTWSQRGKSYDAAAVRSVIRSGKPEGGVTIATLFHIAKRYGYRPEAPTAPRLIDPEEKKCREEAYRLELEKTRKNEEEAAKRVKVICERWKPAKEDHPYVTIKSLAVPETLREMHVDEVSEILGGRPFGYDKATKQHVALQGRLLIVLIKSLQTGAVSAIEMIDERGIKTTNKHGKRKGYWSASKSPMDADKSLPCFIAEGMADAATLYQATGSPSLAAMTASNLLDLAKHVRERDTERTIVICSDIGAGEEEARQAALAVGGKLALPIFPEGVTGKDFSDLWVKCGKDAVLASIAAAMPVGDVWPEPNPLAMNVTPEEYPLDALPAKIRDAVMEFAQHVKAPLPLVASSALATVSLVVQAHIDARRDETLENPVSLYMLTIADSGERKSTCDKHFMRVINEYDREQAELFKPQMETYRADLEAWEAERSGIKARIQKASNEGKDTSKYKNDLRMLERDKPVEPKIPHLVHQDTTPESLARDLAMKWPVGGILSSEAGLVLGAHAMGSESIMRNLSQLNVLWDGGDLQISRKTTESFIVRDVRLTIGLMVQEPTLREFYGKSGKLTRGTGFLARFLVSWPDSTQGSRFYSEPPTGWPARDVFNRRLSDMLKQPIPLDEEGRLVPAMSRMSAQAKEFWTGFYNDIERELGIGGELRDVRDVASKTADNAVRLAAIFQFFEDGSFVIGLDAIEAGCRLAAWHLNEARRFFGEIALPDELAELVNLDAWLVDYAKRRGVSTFSTTEIMQNVTPTKFRKAANLHQGLSLLEAESRLRFEKEGRKKVVHLNPVLLRKE